MKKAKYLAVAIAVLATVSGALAFKANKNFGQTFCTLQVAAGPGTCNPTPISARQFGSGNGNETFYYSEKGALDCDQVQCNESTDFTVN